MGWTANTTLRIHRTWSRHVGWRAEQSDCDPRQHRNRAGFVRLRQMLTSHVDLARKLTALEKKYDAQFKVVFDAIRQLMEAPSTSKFEHLDALIAPAIPTAYGPPLSTRPSAGMLSPQSSDPQDHHASAPNEPR